MVSTRGSPLKEGLLRSGAEIQDLFNKIDIERNGYVTVEKLHASLCFACEKPLSHGSTRKLVSQMARDNASRVTAAEFLDYVTKCDRASSFAPPCPLEQKQLMEETGLHFTDILARFKRKKTLEAVVKGGTRRAAIANHAAEYLDSIEEAQAALKGKSSDSITSASATAAATREGEPPTPPRPSTASSTPFGGRAGALEVTIYPPTMQASSQDCPTPSLLGTSLPLEDAPSRTGSPVLVGSIPHVLSPEPSGSLESMPAPQGLSRRPSSAALSVTSSGFEVASGSLVRPALRAQLAAKLNRLGINLPPELLAPPARPSTAGPPSSSPTPGFPTLTSRGPNELRPSRSRRTSSPGSDSSQQTNSAVDRLRRSGSRPRPPTSTPPRRAPSAPRGGIAPYSTPSPPTTPRRGHAPRDARHFQTLIIATPASPPSIDPSSPSRALPESPLPNLTVDALISDRWATAPLSRTSSMPIDQGSHLRGSITRPGTAGDGSPPVGPTPSSPSSIMPGVEYFSPLPSPSPYSPSTLRAMLESSELDSGEGDEGGLLSTGGSNDLHLGNTVWTEGFVWADARGPSGATPSVRVTRSAMLRMQYARPAPREETLAASVEGCGQQDNSPQGRRFRSCALKRSSTTSMPTRRSMQQDPLEGFLNEPAASGAVRRCVGSANLESAVADYQSNSAPLPDLIEKARASTSGPLLYASVRGSQGSFSPWDMPHEPLRPRALYPFRSVNEYRGV